MNITDTYIENGIKVKVLKGCEFKPRPVRSTVESPKQAYASSMQEIKLLNWCNAGSVKKPRRTALAELSGISLGRIRSCITSGIRTRLTLAEYKKFAALMPIIEEMEKVAL